MSADIDFERALRAQLQKALAREDGPHPVWATSPAAALVAADPARRSRSVPWRLMAVAAVLVVGSVAALILARPNREEDGVPGCPTLADYAAASAQPTPLLGKAPGVSFPPVSPTATMTTGLLHLGDWAVMANADGPGLQIRVRDVRDCGRLPDLRAYNPGGSINLVTVDVRYLRGGTGMAWLGPGNLLEGAVGGFQGGTHVSGGLQGIPGVNTQTWSDPPEGWAYTGTYLLDVPRTDQQIAVDHPTINTLSLPGLEVNDLDSPRARWVLREGGLAPGPFGGAPIPVPGATPTTGEVRPGEDLTFSTSDGLGVMQLRDVDEVVAYPGLLPAPGHVFVEVLMEVRGTGRALTSLRDWRAVDGQGLELRIIHDAYGADQRRGMLRNLLREEETRNGWIVIEAPATGPVRLEYRHEDILDARFWIQLRD